MKWIEAIGAPGVGKSYFLQRLLEVSETEGLSRNWLSEEEIPEKAIAKIHYKDCRNLFQCLLLLYSKQGFLSYKRKGVRAVLVKKMFSDDYRKKGSISWKNYLDLHLKAVRESGYADRIKDFVSDGYSRLVSRFQFYEGLALDNAIYVDEGLL